MKNGLIIAFLYALGCSSTDLYQEKSQSGGNQNVDSGHQNSSDSGYNNSDSGDNSNSDSGEGNDRDSGQTNSDEITIPTNVNGTLPGSTVPVPVFVATNHDGGSRDQTDLIGHPTVIWFFPFADTPG